MKDTKPFFVFSVLFCLLIPCFAFGQYPQILWWYDLDAPSLGSAAVGDIDGDSLLEIAFGTYFNDENIVALNGEDGSLKWDFNTGGCNDASPAIADVDLDGELEVVVPASSPYHVYCLNGDSGTIEWDESTGYPNCIDSPPAVADVDNDGKPEVILGAWYGHVFAFNGEDGSQSWHVNVGASSYIQAGPNILDLDGDNDLDVVVAQWAGDYRVYGLDGGDGSTLWYSDAPMDHMYHGGSFADLDKDGKSEIAIGCYDNRVYVFNHDSSLSWSYTAPYYVGAPTSIGDLNNDNNLEIVFASWNRIGVLSHDGDSLLWSYTAGGGSFRGAAIADVDGNGILDVAFGTDNGYLTVLQGDDGSVVWSYNLQAHYGQEYDIDHAPVIADFDGDGKLDIFVVGGHAESTNPQNNHGRAYALSAGDGTGPGWPMFRHDLYHSACFSGPAGIEEDDGGKEITKEGILESHPNPFNSSTSISFAVGVSGPMSIRIYDVAGTLVQILVDGYRSEGNYTVQWDRRSEENVIVPAGMYFCRFETNGFTAVEKLIVIQ